MVCGRLPRLARLTTVSLLTVLVGAAASSVPADAEQDAAETEFVDGINDLRRAEGLKPLVVDPDLTAFARSWAQEMAATGWLRHNPGLAQILDDDALKVAENVGKGPDVASIEQAFEASASHRRNLVDPDLVTVGVGVVEGDGRLWVVENFRQPMVASPALAPESSDLDPAPAPDPRAVTDPPATPQLEGAGLGADVAAAVAAAADTDPAPSPVTAGEAAPTGDAEDSGVVLESSFDEFGPATPAPPVSGWGPTMLSPVDAGSGGSRAQSVQVAKGGTGGVWLEADIDASRTYTQSLMLDVVSLDPGASVELILEWFAGDSSLVGYKMVSVADIEGALEPHRVIGTAPEAATSVRFAVNVKGGGTYVMDDVRLEMLPPPGGFRCASDGRSERERWEAWAWQGAWRCHGPVASR